VLLDKGLQSNRVGQLLCFFKVECYDLQTILLLLLVKCLKERSLIMAIRAPAPSDIDQHDLAPKLRIPIAHNLPGQIRK